MTSKGTSQTGRFQGNEKGPTVQVGHKQAFAAGGKEVFMLEDADLNQLTGQTIESRGALSDKKAVDIEGVIVDLASAQQWVRLGLLDPAALAAATPVE